MSADVSIRGPEKPERWVDARELAELMGVSVATIRRMTAQGMPSVTWGRRTRRFQPSAVIAWAQAQTRERKAT